MNLSNENRLLLYCAQTRIREDKLNKVKDIIRLPLDWEEVLKSALWQRIGPLLYHNLKDIQESHLIPQEIMEQLRNSYYTNLVRNMYIYAELKRILDAFREEGIEVIVLKGAALAKTAYDDIALRYMNDIDLLVKEQDLDRADTMLSKLGYTSHAYRGWSKDWFRKNSHHLAPFFNNDNGIKVEIHRDVIPPGNPFNLDIRKMWKRAQAVSIGDVHTQVLSLEDLIVHLCLHIAHFHAFRRRIISMVDISQVVKSYREHINWDLIIKEAHENNITDFIYYPLYLAREFLDIEIEKGILDGLKNGSKLRPFEDRLLRVVARKIIFLEEKGSSIFPIWFLRAICKELLRESHTLNKLGALLKIIFLPGTGSIKKDSQTLIKKLLRLFYPILRLLKLIFMFCYRLGRNITEISFIKRL